MHRILHPPNGRAPLCQEEDTGDSFIEMILQPAVMDEVDSKEDKKHDEEKTEEEEDEDEEEEAGITKKQNTRSRKPGSEKKKRLKNIFNLRESSKHCLSGLFGFSGLGDRSFSL